MVVEIKDNKHGKRKYHTSHSMKGQWVFKETDSDSGRKFHINMHGILNL